MRVLLDTCVLSELRRPKGYLRVRRAVEAVDNEDLFLSVISIGEIAKGIGLLKESRKMTFKCGCRLSNATMATAYWQSISKPVTSGGELRAEA